MQTFLPYADFNKSAVILDKKRCWKQVVEAKQILDSLELLKAKYPPKHIPWINHPAAKMWQGYERALMHYFNEFLHVCINKWRINTKLNPMPSYVMYEKPWWLGNEDFHRAMRARLIEKDRDFYLPLFPNDEGFNGGKYFWPVMETKTFRII